MNRLAMQAKQAWAEARREAEAILGNMNLGAWQARWSVSNRQLAEIWGVPEGRILAMRQGKTAASVQVIRHYARQLQDFTDRMERLLKQQPGDGAYHRAVCAEAILTIHRRRQVAGLEPTVQP